jgi:uncharacterized protein YbjT (DUF2867 family)
MKIAVIGASTDAGRLVVARLCEAGHAVVATSRDPARLAGLDPRAGTAAFDIDDSDTPADALAGAERIVSVAHAATVPALLKRIPPDCRRLVVTGSTMRDSAVPDRRAEAVRRGEAAFRTSDFAGSMLHPTMIYGSRNEANVIRVLRLVDRWPRLLPLVWPVPDGGRHRVQPIYVGDVAAALAAAVTVEPVADLVIVIAGPAPMRLADMLRACAAFRGRRLLVLPLPTALLIAVARTLRALTRRSPFSVDELLRSREDKSYDITVLRERLGVVPIGFAEGLERAYREHQYGVEAGPTRE